MGGLVVPRRSAAQIGSEFEDYCRRFLAELGFENVNGGNQFRIGEQIDACGGFEETLVIVEATTTTATRKGKPLLDEIKLIRGKASNIGAELKQNPLYSRYKNVKYVHVVGNLRYPSLLNQSLIELLSTQFATCDVGPLEEFIRTHKEEIVRS